LKNFKQGNFIQIKTANTDAGAFVFAVLRLVDGLLSALKLPVETGLPSPTTTI
jgi:hypothetical protein